MTSPSSPAYFPVVGNVFNVSTNESILAVSQGTRDICFQAPVLGASSPAYFPVVGNVFNVSTNESILAVSQGTRDICFQAPVLGASGLKAWGFEA